MPRGNRYRKRRLSKKRTIRSSKNGPGDKSTAPDSTPVSNSISREDYDKLVNIPWRNDEHTTVLASHTKARELLEDLFEGHQFGLTRDVKIKRLIDVIDARFEELEAKKVAARRARSRTEDTNQTSLFGMLEENHD